MKRKRSQPSKLKKRAKVRSRRQRNTAANEGKSVPGKFTPDVLAKITEKHCSGLTIGEACLELKVSHGAFCQFRAAHPEFNETVEWRQARIGFAHRLEDRGHALALCADNRSPTMIIFMLKALFPAVYRETIKVDPNTTNDFAAAFAKAMEVAVSGRATAA